jgi:hypothetical protein
MRAGSLALAMVSVVWMFSRIAPAQPIQPVSRLAVVDANGKKLGDALSIAAPPANEYAALPYVAFTVNGHMVVLPVEAYGFPSGGSGPFVYRLPDCSGTPYMTPFCSGVDLLPCTKVTGDGLVISIPDPTATPVTVTTANRDYWWCYSGQCQWCDVTVGEKLVPAITLADLSTQFTPPFRLVPASTCCGDCNGDGTVTIDEILTSVNQALNGCHQ